MQRRLRRYAALVIAPVTMVAVAFLAAAPAQAAGAVRAASAAATAVRASGAGTTPRTGPSRRAARPTPIGVPRSSLARLAPAKASLPAKVAASGVRRVCGHARPGFAACLSLVRTGTPRHLGTFAANTAPSGYGPSSLQSAYSLPSATAGFGQTVAVVDAYDDPTAEADLQAYRAQYGLPACTTANGCFEKVNQEGQLGSYPVPNTGWAYEESLDVDMVSAICPNCHILLVEANDNTRLNLGAAVDEAVALGAKYVSNSYGGPESPSDPGTYDQYFNHPGVAVTASAGDSGYGTEFPAASPYVTAVGGTTLTQDSSTARGWTETVWSGTGSGCSTYEPKPTWQTDTGCSNRTVADVSADANPYTGVAVYDSTGGNDGAGWLVFGGTSVASPIIASTFALAGPPLAGSYPSSYPYAAQPQGLNDVTSGSNGTCAPAYLCTAGPGYDGPTGWGTPDGVAAFTPPGPHGDISGEVTDASTGQPVAGATVSTAQGFQAVTGSSGDYELSVSAGSYDLAVRDFGYAEKTLSGVQVTSGQTTTENVALAAAADVTLGGTVTDGGHGWPVYAKITIAGDPNGPVYTSPYTGRYSVSLPAQSTYTLQVTPVYPGYLATDVQVQVGTTNARQDATVSADPATCSAPGYTYPGLYEQFAGWSGHTPQNGWRVVNHSGTADGWEFDNPGGLGNQTGGTGNFATAAPFAYGTNEDTSLISPVVNLTGITSPEIGFDTFYLAYTKVSAAVALSLDGGKTWTNIWRQKGEISGSGQVDIPVPQAAGHSGVRIRFTFTGIGEAVWQLADVLIGSRACNPVRGGLVAGIVRDANTGDPVNGATVTSGTRPPVSATSAVTGDPARPGGGFYWLFSRRTGSQTFTAAGDRYTPATAAVTVKAGKLTRQDWTLHAGHLTVATRSITAAETLGQSRTVNVTFGNDGTSPVRVTVATQDGAFTPKGVPSAAPSWAGIADYPFPVSNSAVAYNDGKVYSVGGFTGAGATRKGYVFDPSTRKWSPIAPEPAAVPQASAVFADGTMYLLGGFTAAGASSASVYAYHPSSGSWSRVTTMPGAGTALGAVAVLNGEIYIVGGCTGGPGCNVISSAYRYDPASNTWTQLPDYPTADLDEACAGIAGEVVCAGGTNPPVDNLSGMTSTYIYHPDTNTWTQGADMPYPAWAMGYAGSHGQLQVFGGAGRGEGLYNQASEYDPASNTWSALPSTNNAVYQGFGSCGLYQVGGLGGSGVPAYVPQDVAQALPGYQDCGGATDVVPWLSAGTTGFTVAPGRSVNVPVTLDSSQVAQPGTYTAGLSVATGTPYLVAPVTVRLTVNPPRTWGRITGTVTDAANGNPIAGASVVIGTLHGSGQVSYPTTTNASGVYQWWLDARYDPLLVSAARDGYQPQARGARVRPGKTTTLNFAMAPNQNSPGEKR